MTSPVQELRGTLSVMPLNEVVPMLAEKRATGLLTVERGVRTRKFELAGGAIVSVSSTDPREYLGQFLVDYGLVSGEAAANAFWFQQATNVMLGRLLPMRGILDEGRVREVLELRIRELFLDTYRWFHGEVVFETDLPERPRGLEVAVKLTDLLQEARNRQRDWQEIADAFPSIDVRLSVVETNEWTGALQPGEEVILELAREEKTVGDALRAFRDGEYHGYLRLLGMKRKGLIGVDRRSLAAPAAAPQLAEATRRLLEQGQPREAWSFAALLNEQNPSRVATKLLRDAEQALVLKLADAVLNIEGTPKVTLPTRELARLDLRPSELYLLMRLAATCSVREAVRGAPMGELESLRAMERLIELGAVTFSGAEGPATGTGGDALQ